MVRALGSYPGCQGFKSLLRHHSGFQMLLSILKNTIEQNETLISAEDRILVAFSGGPDSTALLVALFQLQSEYDFSLCAAHMNHMLRGSESDADQLWCAALAQSLDIPFIGRRIDVNAVLNERGGNMEEIARELRYDFLKEAASELGANRIAVAHTADDQAETVLMRLSRGAGSSGLRGMKLIRNNIIRPLIYCRRRDVEDFLQEKSIVARHDSTNENENYSRVFLRRKVVPDLEQLNPSFVATIGKTAEILGEEDDFLNELSDNILEGISLARGEEIILYSEPFSELHTGLQRRVIRSLLNKASGSLRKFTSRQVDLLRDLALGRGNGVDLFQHRAVPHPEGLLLKPIDYPINKSFNYAVEDGGVVRVKEVDKSFALRIIESGPDVNFIGLSGPEMAFLDADKTGDIINIRNWLPGDRYTPLGAPGNQKLQDLFTNAKVERAERSDAAVFCSGDRICWVSGFRVAEEFRITELTRRILSIEEVKNA